ncbi:MAG: hypothetical protein A2836_01255 [Candidatus Taylorbacteria bacterium RIFCSPHIGHO2_01_FULL_45_63]|uniref:Ribbon-helix-helix protein CopG domain-containing protein n=1 Tax=Candidatus Taylorbacteria bacterium RIFCSPHIGHO2_02_FULL_45_35 TaxID=1802311 RepID=A0A1G2MPI9_9BACT|nr:MAG: hypothetical protein A2836_01255 [Candidatus Taylorbacteria bacterium RIFCSPHIGHO2_01_FULL_45_63]OHA25776.1 MAG: hypothetical protein A3D56_01585 [Candidatus Taylorbacteria bacterium RIFCSPHIGHO2_02_FULL_45_35]OHA32293.1 MAG: hypothetical protein A3A22_01800 [Candidatus Taylorbacteria bacterium RIFCSPLOWO2_01_FULL_45_34b]
MVTTKNRLNISLPRDVDNALSELSRRDKMPRATKAADLLRTALELEEDVQLGVIASERAHTNRSLFVSHEKVWKRK